MCVCVCVGGGGGNSRIYTCRKHTQLCAGGTDTVGCRSEIPGAGNRTSVLYLVVLLYKAFMNFFSAFVIFPKPLYNPPFPYLVNLCD